MIPIDLNTDLVVKQQEAKIILQEKLERFFGDEQIVPQMTSQAQFVRLRVNIDKLDLHSWLNRQKNTVKTYWCDRQSHREMAGIGEADVVQGNAKVDYQKLFARLHRYLKGNQPTPRYYGGIRFNGYHSKADCWNCFGGYRFIVPRFEICVEDGVCNFVCNFIYNPRENWQTLFKQLTRELKQIHFGCSASSNELPLMLSRKDLPDNLQWHRMIKAALKAFQAYEIEKVVLARKSSFEFSNALNPIVLLKRLQKNNSRAFHFCFQPRKGLAFIGSTPELLYYRNKYQIFSEAVAGTRPRGLSVKEDRELEADLLNSHKDVREHRFVITSIRESLNQLCSSFDENESISVLKLTHLQHLYAQFQGVLKNDINDGQILKYLHPTPAVGGYPKNLAIKKINALEPFDRGWYAGPVGWIGADTAEFVVAIRSGLVEDKKLRLYTGAGIINGSLPQKEWEELENKLENFMNILKRRL